MSNRNGNPAPAASSNSTPAQPWSWGPLAGLCTVIGAAAMVMVWWPRHGLTLLGAATVSLLLAGALLAAATSLGAGILHLLGGVRSMPRPLALLTASALGVGAFSLILLIAGLAGGLGRWLFFALPVVGAVAGIYPLWRLWGSCPPLPSGRSVSSRWNWAALVLSPTLAVVIAALSMPPGVLWTGTMPDDLEGMGYDVLEYHLEYPKEYLAAGRVGFLPHNVYSNFPSNAEMWFMMLMGINDPPQSGAYLATALNVLLAVLAGAGVYIASRLGGREDCGGGPLAVVAVAAVPMLATVATVAYVEPMMLFHMAVAWALLRHYQLSARSEEEVPDVFARAPLGTCALAIGLVAGLACGCKYLAIPLMVGPLALGLLATRGLTRLSLRRKGRHALLVTAGVLVAFSPWLVKNALLARNPLYPLLWKTLDGGDWRAEDDARWKAAHLPDIALPQRLDRAWRHFFSHPSIALADGEADRVAARVNAVPRAPGDEPATPVEVSLVYSSLYGPWLWWLCWPIFLTRRRSRWDLLLLVSAGGMLAFWIFCSHVPGRFILPAILPLGLLVGRSMAAVRPSIRGMMFLLMLAPAMVSAMQLHLRFEVDTNELDKSNSLPTVHDMMGDRPTPPRYVFGQLNRLLTDAGATPDGPAKMWLIGESRAFYFRYPVRYNVVFSRDRLAERLADPSIPAEAIRDWLRDTLKVRYVFVNWSEVRRLSRSYGLSPVYARDDEKLWALGRVHELAGDASVEVRSIVPKSSKRGAPFWLIDLDEAPTPTTQPAETSTSAPTSN
ncbi:MAG: hypothetical protein BIFFINMI_01917 [Phycisphaerae bacterium]|nr:hypothetical protein [Phycisphaerae bacterium]